MAGYVPANPLPAEVFVRGSRLERVDASTLMLVGEFEERVGLTRTLFEVSTIAPPDDPYFKRSWESLWKQAALDTSIVTVAWDSYDEAIDAGTPAT